MEIRGPLFDGTAEVVISDLCKEIEKDVAREGVNVVRTRLGQVLKKQTPFYITKIEDVPHAGHMKVTGESVIYHWWLEGKGSRNFPVTRFKGYRTFEISTELLRARAEGIANKTAEPFMRKLG